MMNFLTKKLEFNWGYGSIPGLGAKRLVGFARILSMNSILFQASRSCGWAKEQSRAEGDKNESGLIPLSPRFFPGLQLPRA